MQIGAQLYTLRDFCKTTEDFAHTLKRVADMGYKIVQVSGTCDFEAQWLADQLKANDLKCVLTHTAEDALQNHTQKVIDDHSVFDCRHIGLGYYGDFREGDETTLEKFISSYGPVAKKMADAGKVFTYHHHAFEFRKFDGITILQRLAEEIPEMRITLDTYWVQTAGADPAAWLERFSGRVPCIHLKDHTWDRKMAVVGEGHINFDRVFAAAEKAGTEYMLVEQDECYGEDPFGCLARSLQNLKAMGF